jgi:Gpi18-like mannosyltransferase
MQIEDHSSQSRDASVQPNRKDLAYLLASILIQLLLGYFFGHDYDIKIFMATGYMVANGLDPYVLPNLSAVFHNPAFQGMSSIGYPPPWPLIMGLIYLLSYAWMHNFLVYNLAIKLPIIAANICLAYLVRDILREQGLSVLRSRKAWIFLLFNPFLFYFTTAWGQFDSLVVVLTMAALVLLYKQRLVASPILLALAIALKPTPVPIVLAVLLYLWGAPWKRMAGYLTIFMLSLLIFCVLPFYVLGWSASPIYQGWNAQFTVSGGMSLTTLYELWSGTSVLPGDWWLLGEVWLPAIFITAAFLRKGKHGLLNLFQQSLVLVLAFYLTRTWLSEQNLALIFLLVLILVYMDKLPWLILPAVWVLPLIFTIFNTSPAQLLFPIFPQLMAQLLAFAQTYRLERLWARMIVVIPWQVAGWWTIINYFRVKSLDTGKQVPA